MNTRTDQRDRLLVVTARTLARLNRKAAVDFNDPTLMLAAAALDHQTDEFEATRPFLHLAHVTTTSEPANQAVPPAPYTEPASYPEQVRAAVLTSLDHLKLVPRPALEPGRRNALDEATSNVQAMTLPSHSGPSLHDRLQAAADLDSLPHVPTTQVVPDYPAMVVTQAAHAHAERSHARTAIARLAGSRLGRLLGKPVTGKHRADKGGL